VKLVDFGIARATGRTTKTLTGTLKGKLAYMSPEQCRGKKLDGRSDLFSLGIVLYELTAGVRPFDGESDLDILEKIDHGEVMPPSRVVAGYPIALETIVMRLLANDPGSRYPNAQVLLPELEALVVAQGMFNPTLALAEYMSELFAEELETAEMEDDVRTSPSGRTKRAGTAVTVTVGRTKTEQDTTTAMRETLAALDAGTVRDQTATTRLPVDPIAIELLADLDASAPKSESPHARKRRRIEALLECAFACHGVGDLPRAMVAIELAMSEDPGSDLTRELIASHRSTVTAVFDALLGDKGGSLDERYRALWLMLQ
jgi:serine/threonine protein kinase